MQLMRITIADNGKGAANPYEHHKNLWAVFPDMEKRDFIFAVLKATGAHSEYLVLSPMVPIPPAKGLTDVKLLHSRYEEIRVGNTIEFSLRANPTIQANGRRHSILTHRTASEMVVTPELWLQRKALANGFIVKECEAVQQEKMLFDKQGIPGEVVGVDYRGILEVLDLDQFKGALAKGIGSAKSLGFGMLVLHSCPARTC